MVKTYENASIRTRYDIEQEIIKQIRYLNSFLFERGLKFPQQIELENFNPAGLEYANNQNLKLKIVPESTKTTEPEVRNSHLCVKDLNSIPDKGYGHLAIHSNLTKVQKIRYLRNQINKQLPFNWGKDFAYNSLYDKVYFNIKKVLKIRPDTTNIIIKYCGDGTVLARNLKCFNFNFSIINNPDCMSVYGHPVLGMWKIQKEEYEQVVPIISSTFFNESDTFPQNISIDTLKSITIDDQMIQIKPRLGGDYKFLLMAGGIVCANGYFSCLYCTCPSSKYRNKYDKDLKIQDYCNQQWSINGYGARTLKASEEIRRKYKPCETDKRKGYVNEPLSTTIEYYDYVIDLLHMYLRITELLIKQLTSFVEYDNKKSLLESKYVQIIIKFISKYCNINCSYIFIENGAIEIKMLTGEQCDSIHNEIEFLIEVLIKMYRDDKIEEDSILILKKFGKLFVDFYEIMQFLKIAIQNDYPYIKIMTKKWLIDFFEIIDPYHETCYIHVFAFHLHELLRLHGNLARYNAQGHESFNNFLTLSRHRSTNKKLTKNSSQFKQLLEKFNRIDYFSYNKPELFLKKVKTNKDDSNDEDDSNESLIDILDDDFDDDDANNKNQPTAVTEIQINNNKNKKQRTNNQNCEREYNTIMINDDDDDGELNLKHKIRIKGLFGDYCLNSSDLETLSGNNWLNDEVIGAYLSIIDLPAVIVIPPTNLKSFFYDSKDQMIAKTLSNLNISNYKYIVGCISINHGATVIDKTKKANHWIAILISLQTKEFSALDPFGKLSMKFIDMLLDRWRVFNRDNEWKLKVYRHPTQKDSWNCGVYACTFIEEIVKFGKVEFDSTKVSIKEFLTNKRNLMLSKIMKYTV